MVSDLEAALLVSETHVDELRRENQILNQQLNTLSSESSTSNLKLKFNDRDSSDSSSQEQQSSSSSSSSLEKEKKKLEAQCHDLLLLLANEEIWHLSFREIVENRLSLTDVEDAQRLAQSKGAFTTPVHH